MLNYESKSREELISELIELQKAYSDLKSFYDPELNGQPQLKNNSHLSEKCDDLVTLCKSTTADRMVFTDFTRLNQSQNELRKSEKRFKTIFEDAPLGVALVESVSGKICEVNQMFAKIAGRSVEELTTIDWISITHPDDLEEDLKNQAQLVNGETNGFQMEKRYIRPDGSFVWINMTISRLIKEENMPMLHLCMIEEISERKKVQDQLLEKSSLLEAQVNSVTEGILIVDENNRRILINQRLIDLLKIPDSILNDDNEDTKLLNYVTGLTKKPNLFLEKVLYLYTHKTEKSLDEIEFKDGLILERYSAPIIGKDGQNYGRIWTFRDITEQKRSESEIFQINARLKKVIAEKDKFYSVIAHDLRGPLGGFMKMSELLVEMEDDLTDAEKREIILDLKDSSKNTFTLLEQLLEWTKIDQGMIEFKPGIHDLNGIIAESMKMVTDSAKNKSITIIENVPDRINVYGDRNMLLTILRNLSLNAVKYTKIGGKVTITVEQDLNQGVKFAITDNGIGMSKYLLDNLFKVGVNTNRQGTNGEHSTGLGLLLCKEFIEKHKGEFIIKSQEGKGSTFAFTIPG